MSDLVEALRLEGDRRVCEKEMTFGNGKSREDRIADDLCYEAASRISQQDAELERLRREVGEARAEAEMLQDILDSRPAINAGLPETYIRWSQSIYSGEAIRVALEAKGARQ